MQAAPWYKDARGRWSLCNQRLKCPNNTEIVRTYQLNVHTVRSDVEIM